MYMETAKSELYKKGTIFASYSALLSYRLNDKKRWLTGK